MFSWFCPPSIDETKAKTNKARRRAKGAEEDHQDEARNLQVRAKNLVGKGDLDGARALLQEASRKQRKAKGFSNLRKTAEDLVDLSESIHVRRDLMEVQEELGYHADDRKQEEEPGTRASTQGMKIAKMKDSFEKSKMAFNAAVGDDADDSDADDDDDLDKEWAEKTLVAMRLQQREQDSLLLKRTQERRGTRTKLSSSSVNDVPMI